MTRLRATIGLDIGGTKISGCVIDSNGLVLARGRKNTPAQDPGAIVSESADLIRELAFEREIDAVGVACAGFIDRTVTSIMSVVPTAAPKRNSPHAAALASFSTVTGRPSSVSRSCLRGRSRQARFGANST